MRYIVLLAFLLVGIIAPAQELTIIHEDFDAAKAAAAKENKLLLIDFYTTWCGPCKRLSKAVFDDKKQAAIIAKNYVLLKYDAEKDTKYNLSKKFHISSYPTGVVLNNDGRAILKKYGMRTDENGVNVSDYMGFLDEAVKLQKSNKYLTGIGKETNLDYPQFYVDHVNRVKKTEKDDVMNYWASTTDYVSEVPFCVLAYFGGTDEVNAYFLANKDVYISKYGENDVNSLVYRIVSRIYNTALKTKDQKTFDEAEQLARKHLNKDDYNIVRDYYRLAFWQATGDWQQLIKHVEANKKDFIATGQMNSICWSIFEECDEATVVNKAVGWMADYNKVNPSFAAMDTYANLLFKAGDTQNAIVQMEKAILMGKAEKADTKDSEEALAKFRAAL